VYSGFILSLLQVHLEKLGLMWRILLVGTGRSLYRIARCLFYFCCFNYRTLNPGIVINDFETLCCIKWTKYYKLVLIIGSWMKNVDCSSSPVDCSSSPIGCARQNCSI
jgi:hypothetical protein